MAGSSTGGGLIKRILPVALRTRLRQTCVPLTISSAAEQLAEIIKNLQPDLVHAMRIPYEGMLAAEADPEMPLLVSVWGNDFTLHAPASSRLGRLTRSTLLRVDALHVDCQRDIRLAQVWGFSEGKPAIVLPGAGGIRLDIFHPPAVGKGVTGGDRVINPRGMRAYVCNETFFHSIPIVLEKRSNTAFDCPAMAGSSEALRWVRELGIAQNVDLLPLQTRSQMVGLFQRAQVVVSLTTHDGTPNTLLEAMACGSFPIVGDLESLREWITPGVNGLLVDPRDAQDVARAILLGFEHNELRDRAREHNLTLVAERANYHTVMPQAEKFYADVINSGK